MIPKQKKKLISYLSLIILVFSCAGASLGMLLHTFDMGMATSTMYGVHDNAMQHTCCGEQEQSNTMASLPMLVAHSSVGLFILERALPILVMMSILWYGFFYNVKIFLNTLIGLYMYRWKCAYSFFCLLFRRLFSGGVLHSKAW